MCIRDSHIPTQLFTNGFQTFNGNDAKDHEGNRIIEAFAFELKGNMGLGTKLKAGWYELALISDDGSTLDADMDNNGSYETMLVNNDGLHATKMACSATAFNFTSDTKIPIRLRYYQGPRHHISLNLLVREVDNENTTPYKHCGYEDEDPDVWFGTNANNPAPAPNYPNTPYGETLSDGWFIGDISMFTNEEAAR